MSPPANDPKRFLEELFAQSLATRVFSGYQLVAQSPRGVLALAGGVTSYWPDALPVDHDTWFDIGSVTKAFATTTLVASLTEEGKVALDDRLDRHLPELASTPLASLPLAALLAHSSGLLAWAPVYRETDRAGLLRWFAKNAARLLIHRLDEKAVYSDLGFLLLGSVVERHLGDVEKAFQERVATPLQLSKTAYRVPQGAVVAATEFCLERKRLLQGEVFDENAAHLGPGSGHAGLFSTAHDMVRWVRERWLHPEGKAARFVALADRVPGSVWRLGWEGKSLEGSTAGSLLSAKTFGHLGYPGASVWCDPERELVVAFVSNRVHPSRVDFRIRAVRPAVHDAVAQWCDAR